MSSSSSTTIAFKTRALESLIDADALSIHPSLCVHDILVAKPNELDLKFPVSELAKIVDGGVQVEMADLILFGGYVAEAAWHLGLDDVVTAPATTVLSSDSKTYFIPRPDESLVIRGKAMVGGGVLQLSFGVTVSRQKVHKIACMGFQTRSLTPPATPPIASLIPVDARPAPPLHPKRSSLSGASGTQPATKRPAPPQSSHPQPSTSSAPPPPPSRLPSLLNRLAIAPKIAPPALSAQPGSATSAPTPAASANFPGPPSSTALPAPVPKMLDEKRAKLIAKKNCLSNYGDRNQLYMLAACRAKHPKEALQLKKALNDIGIQPINIDHEELFVGSGIFNFYFDVPRDSMEKMDEKAIGIDWIKLFHVANISQAKSFFSLAMVLGEFFQTTLVATRMHREDRFRLELRAAVIWSEVELKRALQNERVLEALESKLNDRGKEMKKALKKELGI